MTVLTRDPYQSGTLSPQAETTNDEKRVTQMDLDTAATIAWCLMGAVMVGVVLMYGCMYRVIDQAYEEGRQDSLSRVRAAAAAGRTQDSPSGEPLIVSTQSPTASAA